MAIKATRSPGKTGGGEKYPRLMEHKDTGSVFLVKKNGDGISVSPGIARGCAALGYMVTDLDEHQLKEYHGSITLSNEVE